jgi:hypothetical protein
MYHYFTFQFNYIKVFINNNTHIFEFLDSSYSKINELHIYIDPNCCDKFTYNIETDLIPNNNIYTLDNTTYNIEYDMLNDFYNEIHTLNFNINNIFKINITNTHKNKYDHHIDFIIDEHSNIFNL